MLISNNSQEEEKNILILPLKWKFKAYCDIFTWILFLGWVSPEVKCLHQTSSSREMCMIYHKFSHQVTSYMLNEKNVNIMCQNSQYDIAWIIISSYCCLKVFFFFFHSSKFTFWYQHFELKGVKTWRQIKKKSLFWESVFAIMRVNCMYNFRFDIAPDGSARRTCVS